MKFRLPNLTHVINLLLLVACIVGLVLLIGERLKLPQQQFLYERLTARYGDLDVGDGTEFVVVNFPTDSPHVFAWRFFCPANSTVHFQNSSADNPTASSGSFAIDDAKEFRHSISFKFVQGYCQTYVHGMGGISGGNGFGSEQMNRFLELHWNQLNFEVLGSTGPVRISLDEVVPLFKVEIPESLRDELESEVDEVYREGFLENPLFQITYGTATAFATKNGGTKP